MAVAYEAVPTGVGLYRSLTMAGIRCEVVAPPKLQNPSGDRVKADAKDVVHLARLLRLDEITSACRYPRSVRKQPVTWCGPVRTAAAF